MVGGRPRSAALNRHRFERIIELCTAVTAHAICSSANGEDAAEIAVVTPKQEIDQRGDLHSSHLLEGSDFRYSQGQCTSDTEMIIA